MAIEESIEESTMAPAFTLQGQDGQKVMVTYGAGSRR